MDGRPMVNPLMPRPLVWAQATLYLWAGYAVLHGVVQGRFETWEVLFGFARVLAAFGIANNARLAYWVGVLTCGVSLLPPIAALVQDPVLAVHPDFVVLLVLPITVLFALLTPAARDYQRVWFH
jgi:hypothetical protein